jgi:TrmH family RNA methyltransferase
MQDGVFMLPGGCDPFNEKALRASRGASFRLPIATGRWSQLQAFADMHKMKLYAADPDQKDATWPSPRTEHVIGTDTETTDTLGLEPESSCKDVVSNDSIAIAAAKESLCLILGSEGQGLSENAHRSCERVSIPMPGDFESLNVAVAGGILLYLLNNKIAVPNVAS